MTEFKSNTFEDSDFRDVITEFEDIDAEAEEISASARGKISALRKKQKALKKRAKDDLGIPTVLFTAALKTRRLERQLQDVAADIPDEWTEVWQEDCGQFLLFGQPANDDAEDGESPAQRAAAARAQQAKEANEAEQAEGAAVLNDLVH